MSEVDMVGIVHTVSPDLEHRSWICRATHINDEYITTNMGRFSTTTRYGVGPANQRIKLVLEGDDSYQTRLDLGVTRGGYWAIQPSGRYGVRIRASLDEGVLPR